MIISMFQAEADAWIEPLGLNDEIKVPGLSSEFPNVRCSLDEVCQLTTGMGHSNAAASTMAVVFSGQFNLSRSYFLVAGISGIDPSVGTIGSAAWARYLVDFGLQNEIDAREMPPDWESGYFGIGSSAPDAKPHLAYRTEVFQLNEELLRKALALSSRTKLEDNDIARQYRSRYSETAASSPPSVIQCDTAAGDTYWHGQLLERRAEKWTALLTDGKGRYCTSQQEDNAIFEALTRGADAGLLDSRRVAVLRTGSNFDRPYRGQSTYDSLTSTSVGFPIATRNLYIAGEPLVSAIVSHWADWQNGVPSD